VRGQATVGEGARTAPQEEQRARALVAFGRALSDPIRVRMLGLLAAAAAEGRGCCGLPDTGAPEGEEAGVCVCEFENLFGLGQSKVSYHLRKLKEAGLVREERRGRWSFYSLDRDRTGGLISEIGDHLLPRSDAR
jgi:ArsR family transcriptional regulator, arsenate/arsenite/antimonite-responsive transcriptional repressor